MLERVIERLRRCKRLDNIIIATTTSPEDDKLESLCELWNVDCYRGSVDDVLARYYDAAKKFGVDIIVRITSDCPLIDPSLVDEVINLYLDNRDKYDYCSNVIPPTYPDGLDVEVFPMNTLERLNDYALEPFDREHVTTFVEKHPERFKIGNIADGINRSKFRWTVDGFDDLQFVNEVFKTLYKPNEIFTRENVFELLRQHPELMAINAGHKRNEGHNMTQEEKEKMAISVR